MYRVIITEQAREDADAIYNWMREHRSPEFAERWYQGLFRQIDTLTRLPRRCPVASESRKFPTEIRELLHGRRKSATYRILFQIDAETVTILYVRHSARDELEP